MVSIIALYSFKRLRWNSHTLFELVISTYLPNFKKIRQQLQMVWGKNRNLQNASFKKVPQPNVWGRPTSIGEW